MTFTVLHKMSRYLLFYYKLSFLVVMKRAYPQLYPSVQKSDNLSINMTRLVIISENNIGMHTKCEKVIGTYDNFIQSIIAISQLSLFHLYDRSSSCSFSLCLYFFIGVVHFSIASFLFLLCFCLQFSLQEQEQAITISREL